MSAGRPILVTGSPRSGTTWCGKVLSSQPSVFYVDEPFHQKHPPGVCRAEFDRWFQHVSTHNEGKYHEALQKTVELRYAVWRQIRTAAQRMQRKSRPGLSGIAEALMEWGRWRSACFSGKRPLLKDPIALFSAEWLADRFDAQVVVMVRHPAGFVHSIQRAGWRHPIGHLTSQPALINGVLSPIADELRKADDQSVGIVEEAILLWKAMYYAVHVYRQRHPEWIIVRNEDLAEHPMEEYQRVCSHLNLPFDVVMRSSVQAFSNPSNESGDVPLHATQRDSRSEAWKWKNKIGPDVLERILEGTSPVWQEFYSTEEMNKTEREWS